MGAKKPAWRCEGGLQPLAAGDAGMICAEIRADVPFAALPTEEGYARTRALLDAIDAALPSPQAWFGGITKPRQQQVPFSDKAATLARAEQRTEMFKEKFPTLPYAHGYAAYLSNRQDLGRRRPGQLELTYDLTQGRIELDIERGDVAFGADVTRICRDVLTAIVRLEPISFAYVDVVDRSLATDEVIFYRLNYATFPHRKALGWMGFVPAEVAPAQLPLAAELVPVAGKGTVIVAVDAPFDLNDPAHIRRANQVEMDMVDLGLLPVTDPNYR